MIRCAGLFALLLLACAAAPVRAAAQAPGANASLEEFIQRVSRYWAEADVSSLLELLPADNLVILDTGSGIENANSRHAAAALRALFAESESVSVRPIRVTVASTAPARGFGELTWTFRARGSRGEQSRSVYVAGAVEEDTWRITELRLMP